MLADKKLIVVESAPYMQVMLDAALGDKTQVLQLGGAMECIGELDSASCIFVDLMLEEIDGLSLIEKIRLRNRDIPVAAFVASTELNSLDIDATATRSMAHQSGADAVFITPFNLGEIMQTVTQFLEPVAATA
ncbi:MAG: response regulator [Pseudomonadales bacterium]|nr:response regulator [Pseudomonadales bacterium]